MTKAGRDQNLFPPWSFTERISESCVWTLAVVCFLTAAIATLTATLAHCALL